MSEIVRWGDEQQYVAKPMLSVTPQVHLLWATPDPLGAIAAVSRMYKGIPTYDLDEITDEDRRFYWDDSFKTHLRAPHEFVQFHFFVEGVTRSHTHQMVRQRTATFAQESLRFAVKDNLAQETAMPPSIVEGSHAADVWNSIVDQMQGAYEELVNSGIPAEDARGLLPHAVTTRLHWRTNLNDLLHHAGNRLCTQAQFEWRIMMISLMKAIREHKGENHTDHQNDGGTWSHYPYAWQFELIGTPSPKTFAPICYQLGKCQFEGSADRDCSIRARVNAFAEAGVPSDRWSEEHDPMGEPIPGINYEEWLLNPAAARR